MKLVDRYIVRQFCINFAILLLVLLLLFISVDLMVNLDEFLEAGRVRAEQMGSLILGMLYSIYDYYYPLTVLLYVFFSGLVAVAAMGFTLAGMHRSRELTALLASGVSFYRVAMPIIVVSILFNALALPAREYILPEVASKLMRSSADVKHDTMQGFAVWFAPAGDGNLLSARRFAVADQTLYNVILNKRNQTGLTQQRVEAAEATWDAQSSGWRLRDVTIRRWDLASSSGGMGTLQQRPELFYQSELSPEVLVTRQASNYLRFTSLGKLQSLKDNQALTGRRRVEIVQAIWSRFSLLVLNVLVLVMALPFFLQPRLGSLLMQSLKSAGLVMPVWGGGLTMLTVPSGMFPPVVAVWLPVVLCLPLTAILLQFVRT